MRRAAALARQGFYLILAIFVACEFVVDAKAVVARASGVVAPPAATAPAAPRPPELTARAAEALAVQIAQEGPALMAAPTLAATEGLIAGWAEASVAAGLARQIHSEALRLAGAPSGPSGFWVGPVAGSVSLVPGGARVRLLCAEVVIASGQAAYARWVIEDMTFRARGGAWALAATADAAAPVLSGAPGSLSTPPPEAVAELAGFSALAGQSHP